MNILEQLIQGNSFSEYDAIFHKAEFKDIDLNMNLVQIIDASICNAGRITRDEVKSIESALNEIKGTSLNSRYQKLVSDVLSEAQHLFPSNLQATAKQLIV